MHARALVAAVVAVGASTAQLVGGVTGVFEKIVPTPNENGQNIYPDIPLWRHAVNVEGGVFVAGMNSAAGKVESWALDTTSFVWRKFGIAPEDVTFNAPDLLTFGGFIIAVGGASDNLATSLWYMAVSAGVNASWRSAIVRNQPDPHDGHRVIVFGGIMYMFGGLVQTGTKAWSNAVWALDIAGWFAAGAGTLSPSWVRLTASPNSRWAPRGAMSVDTYASSLVMFGGFTRDPNYTPPAGGGSVCAAPAASCATFNDLWVWAPGLPRGPPAPCAGDADCGWTLVQPRSSVVPGGRFNHASGVLADNLYVFGGSDANGVYMTDLWAFNFEARTWTAVQSSWVGGSVGFPPQTWAPAAAFNGHRLYIEGTGDENGNAMYRWTPEAAAPAGGGGGGGGGGSTPGVAAGAAAAAIFSAANAAMLAFFVYRAVRGGGGAGGIPAAAAGDAYAQLDTA